MAQALDVARYLIKLASQEPEPEYLTHMRLQKLLYYVQGWSLALAKDPMFDSSIEAWVHGPVVRNVYPSFASYGDAPISIKEGEAPTRLNAAQRAFVESIWESYKKYSAIQLRAMTHREAPWLIARGDCKAGDKSDVEISHESLIDFFSEEFRKTQVPGLELDKIQQARQDLQAGYSFSMEEVFSELAE